MLEKVFGAVSFAHEDTHTPMLAALAGLAAAVAGGIALFPAFGYIGVAAAIALSGWVGAGLLGVLLYRRGWLRLDARRPRAAAAHRAAPPRSWAWPSPARSSRGLASAEPGRRRRWAGS